MKGIMSEDTFVLMGMEAIDEPYLSGEANSQMFEAKWETPLQSS